MYSLSTQNITSITHRKNVVTIIENVFIYAQFYLYNYRHATSIFHGKRKSKLRFRFEKVKGESKSIVNDRDESYSASIFREAAVKKVNEIISYLRRGGTREGEEGWGHSCLHFYFAQNLNSTDETRTRWRIARHFVAISHTLSPRGQLRLTRFVHGLH